MEETMVMPVHHIIPGRGPAEPEFFDFLLDEFGRPHHIKFYILGDKELQEMGKRVLFQHGLELLTRGNFFGATLHAYDHDVNFVPEKLKEIYRQQQKHAYVSTAWFDDDKKGVPKDKLALMESSWITQDISNHNKDYYFLEFDMNHTITGEIRRPSSFLRIIEKTDEYGVDNKVLLRNLK